MDTVSSKKRIRDESSELTELTQAEFKRFKEDFLDELDDTEICTASHDLDSFMKSFEQEISGPLPATESYSGESRPALGCLLGASDDELGIPATVSSDKLTDTELFRVATESGELSELWRFDEAVSGYDSFGFDFHDDVFEFSSHNSVGEFVALDSLFDYTDTGFGSPKILPALQ